MISGGRLSIAALLLVAAAVLPGWVPEILAFPYRLRSDGSDFRSERPLVQAEIDKVVAKSKALVAASPLARPNEPRRIFLTEGGWRWTWLTLLNRGAFAVSRPGRETIVVNRSDPVADRVWNGQAVGGVRTLSGTIAHETCHGLERRQFGFTIDWTAPAWLREGYCDYVASESSLSAAEVAKLRATGRTHPALTYFEGRRRVAEELRRNGGNVATLFASAGE